jgi:hypothetical protein
MEGRHRDRDGRVREDHATQHWPTASLVGCLSSDVVSRMEWSERQRIPPIAARTHGPLATTDERHKCARVCVRRVKMRVRSHSTVTVAPLFPRAPQDQSAALHSELEDGRKDGHNIHINNQTRQTAE